MKQVEICCGSYYDAKQAFLGGARRIELNSALHLGGLTPSLATLLLTKKHTDLKVICMVRPRGAGFFYHDEDFETMKEDCRILMKHGADGIAFGCLHQDGTIHEKQTKELVQIIKKYHGEAIFHRAFDCVKDPFSSIETLIDLNVDRVLTSGLQNKAIEGIPLLKKLQETYGDKIEILAGSGINAKNALTIMKETGIDQVHSSCKDWLEDVTTSCNHVSYAYASLPYQDCYEIVSQTLVKQLVESIKEWDCVL